MSFEAPAANLDAVPEKEKGILPFPAASAGIEAYRKEYADHNDRAEVLQSTFQEFLKEELDNSKIFTSPETGIQMPYTSINIGKIASRIYEKTTGRTIETKDSPVTKTKKEKFVLATAPLTDGGEPFQLAAIEFAMHDYVIKLRTALDQIQKGEVPDDEEIYTIGMPTNHLGRIPVELVEKISRNPFDELGKVYGEFIAEKVGNGENMPKNIEVVGMSLGANLAIRAGENLMDRNVATQDHKTADEKHLPYLELRTDVPVSLSDSKIKKLQIPAGFIADSAVELTLPYVRKNLFGKEVGEYKKTVAEHLAKNGIGKQLSPDQDKAKKAVAKKIVFSLGNGLEPRKDTKITSVYGLNDLTSVTPGLRKEAGMQKEAHAETLGQNIVGRTRDNERRFTAEMLHMQPWFRKNELRRMDALAQKIVSLKSSS